MASSNILVGIVHRVDAPMVISLVLFTKNSVMVSQTKYQPFWNAIELILIYTTKDIKIVLLTELEMGEKLYSHY